MTVEAVKTENQRIQVEAHLLESGQVYFDCWKLGINTALRIGDLLQLTMDTVRNLSPVEPAIELNERKTGKYRKIAINGAALAVMQRRLADNPKHKYLFQTEAPNVSKRSVQPISRRSVLRVFDHVGRKVSPQVKMGTHSMRKTRGFAMHEAGKSIESIAKVLNHSSPAVTMRYIGIDQRDIDRSYHEFEL